MQISREVLYKGVAGEDKDLDSVIAEITRTIRVVYTEGKRYQTMRRILKSSLQMSLLQVKDNSSAEIDTLMSLIPEMAFQTASTGSPCVNREGKSFTILGLVNKDTILEPQHKRPLYLSRQNSKLTHVQGLYYDPLSPERQDVVFEDLTRVQATIDLDPLNTDEAIQSSITFSDPNICRQLMETAFDHEDQDLPPSLLL